MCGLVGFVITDPEHPSVTDVLRKKYMRYFERALLLDVVRGEDSTGVAAVVDDSVHILKKAVPSYDFLDMRTTGQFLYQDLPKTQAMLGHNRAATQGKVNNSNSHPFTHGDITLMHNGTLWSDFGTVGDFAVDSENICFTVATAKDNAEVIEMLETIYGAFALIWYNAKENTINFARNEERPLKYMMTPTGFIYASEAWMIHGGLSDPFGTELATVGGVKELPVGEWRKISLNDGSTTTIPFVPDAYYAQAVGGAGTGGGKTTTQGTVSSTSYNNMHPDLVKLGVREGDTLLAKVVEELDSPTNPNPTLVCKIVSQAGVELPDIETRVYPKTEASVKQIRNEGKKFLAIEPGGWWIQDGQAKIFCHGFQPVGTRKQFKKKMISSQYDSVYLAEVYQSEAELDDIPFDPQAECTDVFYDWNGAQISLEELQSNHNTCAWCSHPINHRTQEIAWMDDDLIHEECSVEYEQYMDIAV